jgi:hypothetical protein
LANVNPHVLIHIPARISLACASFAGTSRVFAVPRGAWGKESLDLELARRHAETPEARSRIPAPPGPNKTSRLWLVLAPIAVLAIWIALYRML